jgi:hypothetical protein
MDKRTAAHSLMGINGISWEFMGVNEKRSKKRSLTRLYSTLAMHRISLKSSLIAAASNQAVECGEFLFRLCSHNDKTTGKQGAVTQRESKFFFCSI